MQITNSLRQRWQAPLNRRSLLFGAAASLVTIAIGANSHLRQHSLAEFQFSDFYAVRGTQFRLYQPDGRLNLVKLTVVKASSFSTGQNGSPRQECFSLAFDSIHGQRLAQGTYTFAHPQLGSFDLFVAPTQPLNGTERCIAIINRFAA